VTSVGNPYSLLLWPASLTAAAAGAEPS